MPAFLVFSVQSRYPAERKVILEGDMYISRRSSLCNILDSTKREAICSSETLLTTSYATLCHNPDNRNMTPHFRENLESSVGIHLSGPWMYYVYQISRLYGGDYSDCSW
jgi:hypothetical protein